MKKNHDASSLPPEADELRRRAEAQLQEQPAQTSLPLAPETLRLLHELQIYQIELELQNRELWEARTQLEQSLERYTDLYDFAPAGYFTLSADGTIQEANLTGATLLNQTRSDLINRWFGLFVSAATRIRFNAFLDTLSANRSQATCEITLALEGAPLRDLHLEGVGVGAGAGRLCRIVAVDITARRQMEAALLEQERQFSALLQTVPAGVGITKQRIFQQANDYFYQMLGYAPAELIGQSARRLYASDAEFERVGQEKYRQIERTGFGTAETRWRCKNGRLIDVFLRSAAVAPKQPESGIVFVAVDISERKRMETALRVSERRYRDLVELLPYGVQESDCEGRITFANPALERLHGRFENSVVGQFIWDFLADAVDRERLRDYLQFLVREQPPPQTYYSQDRHRDGSIISVQTDWLYRRDEHGQLQGFIAVISDVTEQQRTRLRLVEHTARLQQISRRLFSVQEEERQRLARELHDDLGQQLAALKLNLATLNHRLSATEHQRYIADSLEIVNHTLERLRDVARDLRPSVLDDLGLAAALHGHARRQAERASCKIEVWDRLPPLSPEVETAVFRIVQEAINNATRHGMAQNITVSVEVCDWVLSLTIRDNGGGFDPALVSANSPPGLGLSIMRERAELLNGRFDLASQPGQGVVITVTIPVAEAMP